MALVLLVFFVSLGFVTRTVLILFGMHKGPVLAIFEQYGDQEPFYYPWTWLLFWFGPLTITGGFMLQSLLRVAFATNLVGLFFIFCAVLASNLKEYFQENPEKLPMVPRWYARLCEDTSRYERRRIAYMWLRLPMRTRLLYNASNHAFFLWTDLVVIATVREA